jgi:hypothetical protein
MNKFVALSAFAATLIAVPATAAEVSTIRVSVPGKSAAQLDREIKDAANTVCGAKIMSQRSAAFHGCVQVSLRDANLQRTKLLSGNPTLMAAARPAATPAVELAAK